MTTRAQVEGLALDEEIAAVRDALLLRRLPEDSLCREEMAAHHER